MYQVGDSSVKRFDFFNQSFALVAEVLIFNYIDGVWVVIFIGRNCLCIDLVRVDEVLNLSQVFGANRNKRDYVLLKNFV